VRRAASQRGRPRCRQRLERGLGKTRPVSFCALAGLDRPRALSAGHDRL